MKNCIECGTQASDEISVCPQCGRDFNKTGVTWAESPSTSSEITSIETRPSGKNAKLIGGLLLGAGLFAFLCSLMVSTTGYDGPLDPNALSMKWALAWFGAGFFHFGLLIWLVGYVVHAISFLPKKDEH